MNNNNSIKTEGVDLPASRISKGILIFALILLSLNIFKYADIYIHTIAGEKWGWPLNTYLYLQSQRFTDWTTTMAWAVAHGDYPGETANHPWDINSGLGRAIPPAAYGPFVFLAMAGINALVGRTAAYFVFLGIFFVALVIFSSLVQTSRKFSFVGLGMTLFAFAQFYPIHFAVDRGNSEILTAIVFISASILLVYGTIHNCFERLEWVFDAALICMVLLKPVWITIFLFFVVYRSLGRVIVYGVLVIFGYAILLNAYGASFRDLFAVTNKAFQIFGATNAGLGFSSDLTTLVRGAAYAYACLVHPIESGDAVSLFVAEIGYSSIPYISVIAVIFCGTLALLLRFRGNKSMPHRTHSMFLFLGFIIIATILFTSPGPDYRLLIITPFVIGYPFHSRYYIYNEQKIWFHVFCIAAAILFSFSNYFMRSDTFLFPVFSPIRALCLLAMLIVISKNLLASVRWTPETGQDRSLIQTQHNDPHVKERTSA